MYWALECFEITHCNGCLFIIVSHTGTGVLGSTVIMSSINSAVNQALKAECILHLPAAFSTIGHSQLLLLNLVVHERFVTRLLTFQRAPFLQATFWSEFHSSEFYFFVTDITELDAVFSCQINYSNCSTSVRLLSKRVSSTLHRSNCLPNNLSSFPIFSTASFSWSEPRLISKHKIRSLSSNTAKVQNDISQTARFL